MKGNIPTHLDEILKGGGAVPKAPEPDPDAIMESLGPCAWCFPKGQHALDVEDGANPVVTFQYVFLGIKASCDPMGFTIYFKDGDTTWRLTVEGRNLRPVYDRINEHRVRRIRKADKDFAPDGDKEPVIRRISVDEVKPEKVPVDVVKAEK
jgi:hypothetical protein